VAEVRRQRRGGGDARFATSGEVNCLAAILLCLRIILTFAEGSGYELSITNLLIVLLDGLKRRLLIELRSRPIAL